MIIYNKNYQKNKITNLKIADSNFNCFPSLFTIEWAASAILVFDPLLRQIS